MTEGPLTVLAELRRRQGQPEESHRLLDRAGTSAGAQLCRACLALDHGDASLAMGLAERVLRNVPADRPLERVPALEVLARAQISDGDVVAAETALDELRDIASRVATTALDARMMLLEGMLAAVRGDHQAAKPRLEDAVDAFERCRAPYDAACARLELSATLFSVGRGADAQREAQQAHDRLRELGADAGVARARRLAEPTVLAGDDPAAGLSPREREVLSLVAEGLTNRRISQRLFISEHTVHRHVTSILRKLNAPSRAAAAAHAVRVGLAADPDP
jgi:ATP/maltotriose-dependent transcriptional regulator MalT